MPESSAPAPLEVTRRVLALGVVLLVVGLLPLRAQGQVNTERMRALDVEGVRATLGSDVALQSGTVDLFEIGLTGRFDVRRGRHYSFLATEIRYGTKDDVPFRDRLFAHLRYNARVLPWLETELFSQWERDGFARLQLRSLLGGGLRVQYVNADRLKLFQGTTPMYEYENLEASGLVQHPATVSTVRWSNYLHLWLQLGEAVHLIGTVYVQPRLDAFSDVRVLHQATLGVGVTDRVQFTTELTLSYDRHPPRDVEPRNLMIRNGIRVSF